MNLHAPWVVRAIEAVRSGAVGELLSLEIRHSESFPPYEGGPLPEWYRDVGYPFALRGNECLVLIRKLLGSIRDVDAQWSSTGGDPNLAFDDWRATVRCERGSAQLHLTWSATPGPSQITFEGTKQVRRVDLRTTVRGRPLPPIVSEYVDQLRGKKGYSISISTDPEITTWLDKVVRAAEADHAQRLAKFPRAEKVPFLVTGANGSLGRAIVKRLRADGHRVRVFVRRMPTAPEPGLEYAFGNLGDPIATDRAVRGVEIVIHAGAAMKGGWREHRTGTVIGTQNVVDACKQHGTRQLVYISSMSVIDWAGAAENGPVDESAKLEPRAEERGDYTRAKLEAECIVTAAVAAGLPGVILRPGQIFGGGIELINGAVARQAAGRWLVLGDGELELPLVYIDDVVDAIIQAIDKQLTHGEIIQLVDPERLTQNEVLALAGGARPILAVPRALVFALGKLSELPLGVLGRRSPVAVYRLKSALARLRYESGRASTLLGWHPRVGVREGIKRIAPVV